MSVTERATAGAVVGQRRCPDDAGGALVNGPRRCFRLPARVAVRRGTALARMGVSASSAAGVAVSVLCAALLIPWDAAGIDAPSGRNALSVCDPAPLMFTMQEWALARRSGPEGLSQAPRA